MQKRESPDFRSPEAGISGEEVDLWGGGGRGRNTDSHTGGYSWPLFSSFFKMNNSWLFLYGFCLF